MLVIPHGAAKHVRSHREAFGKVPVHPQTKHTPFQAFQQDHPSLRVHTPLGPNGASCRSAQLLLILCQTSIPPRGVVTGDFISYRTRKLTKDTEGGTDSGGNCCRLQHLMTFLAFLLVQTSEPVLSFAVRCSDKHLYRKHRGEERVYVLTLPNPCPSLKEAGAELKQDLQIPAEKHGLLACSLPLLSWLS